MHSRQRQADRLRALAHCPRLIKECLAIASQEVTYA